MIASPSVDKMIKSPQVKKRASSYRLLVCECQMPPPHSVGKRASFENNEEIK